MITVQIEPRSGREQRLAAHVFAAAEQQGRPVGVGVALDVANKDDVIAAIVAGFIASFETSATLPKKSRPLMAATHWTASYF
jgi:hypothetical protein